MFDIVFTLVLLASAFYFPAMRYIVGGVGGAVLWTSLASDPLLLSVAGLVIVSAVVHFENKR